VKLHPFLIVLLVLGAGALLIPVLSPAPSVCTVQFEALKKSLAGVFFPIEKDGKKQRAAFKSSIQLCREGNSRGACMSFFDSVNSLNLQVNLMEASCLGDLKSTELTDFFKSAFDLYLQLGWGDFPVKVGQFSWLTSTEVKQFCQVKRHLQQIAGAELLEDRFTMVAATLPGVGQALDLFSCEDCSTEEASAQRLSSQSARNRSLLIVKCSN
jgi:hypothetical protein